MAVLGAILTAIYMLRLLLLTFHGGFRGTPSQAQHLHESPAAMTIPLVLLAILSLAGGLVQFPHIFGGHEYLNEFLAPQVAAYKLDDPGLASMEYTLLGGTIIGLLLIFVITRKLFAVKQFSGTYTGFRKVLADKWYVDECYDFIIIKPVRWLGRKLLPFLENTVIDGIVNGVGKLVQVSSRQLRLVQSGQVGSYVLLMVISILIFFVIQFLLKK